MAHPLNVLIIGKDPTLFEHKETMIGDTRKRHITYSKILGSHLPGSQIRIITYTQRSDNHQVEHVNDNLIIYGTSSFHRASYIFGVARLLAKVLNQGWRPDIITVQTPWEEGVIGFLISKLVKAKFILQLHFDLFSTYWRDEAKINRWRAIIARLLVRNAHAIRVVSGFQKRALIENFGIPEKIIRVIPVGVNFLPLHGEKSDFKNSISTSLTSKKVILFVGRFYKPKNLHLWIDAAERIRDHIHDVKFVMVGNGPMFSEIRNEVEERKLGDYFLFLGYVRHEELPAIYAAADIFLLSSYYEGFGRVVLESYMAGVPVVSTKCAGTLDLIDHESTGLLCPVNDADALANSSIKLLKNDSLRMRYGEQGRIKVENKFCFSKLANDLVDFWRQTCNEGS